MKAGTAWLLDAPIYVFRAWFGMPDNWRDPDGRSLNAVIGFSSTILTLLEKIAPEEPFLAAFDESLGTNYRNEIYSNYKISRALPDPELIFQFDVCKKILSELGISSFSGRRYEADDYIASLSELYRRADYNVRVITRDKDLSQLISGNDCVCFDPISGKETNEAAFKKEALIAPFQVPDFIGLVGDSVDDIPGVPGIGKKTAVTLLCKHGSLEGIEAYLNTGGKFEIRGGDRVGRLLNENWDKALMSRELARLNKAIPNINIEKKTVRSGANYKRVEHLLSGWNAPESILIRCNRLAMKFS